MRAVREIAAAERPGLEALQAQLHDLLLLAEAQAQARTGELLFVIEGWMPEPALAPLRERVARELGPDIVVAKVGTEPWTRADAPVALANPRLFRPFELITRAFPLPRYGSIDPTPFVAVFFPMFFGLMLGDVGYGLLLAAIAAVVRRRSRPGSTVRAVAEMALGCALFTIVFGVLFGEFFGTLGATFGMRPLAFDRENALAPFLMFTIALGAVHVVLGLVLAVVGAWRQGQRRQAVGRGLTIAMIALSALALLAAFKVLPSRLFTPAAIAVLIAFPVLVALEGIIAVVELMSAFGHILSYARIMALGTASLMLAIDRQPHGRRPRQRARRRGVRAAVPPRQFRDRAVQPDDPRAAPALRRVLRRVLQPRRGHVPAVDPLASGVAGRGGMRPAATRVPHRPRLPAAQSHRGHSCLRKEKTMDLIWIVFASAAAVAVTALATAWAQGRIGPGRRGEPGREARTRDDGDHHGRDSRDDGHPGFRRRGDDPAARRRA